jgi:hypothetical protein
LDYAGRASLALGLVGLEAEDTVEVAAEAFD